MTALNLRSIGLCSLALGVALVLAAPVLAGDVSVRLDSGAGFSVKNSTGTERLRIDEATGNVSRNGALFLHTTGSNNIFVGENAGNTSTSGFGRNSVFGTAALQGNTSGRYNSAFGALALRSNTEGNANSAFGDSALFRNTTGVFNSAFGAAPSAPTAQGPSTLPSAIKRSFSIPRALTTPPSEMALFAPILTDVDNSAVGHSALYSNIGGLKNSAVGSRRAELQHRGQLELRRRI